MSSFLNVHDPVALQRRINAKSVNLFKARLKTPELQVSNLTEPSPNPKTPIFKQNQTVLNVEQVESLRRNDNEALQLFSIQQKRSWTTLDISQNLFETFLHKYGVFSEFWDCAFAFGRKTNENEFEFPSFRMRRTPTPNHNNIFESSCVLRRAELNNRKLTEGQSPWSIRQTAVYHQRIPIVTSENASDSVHIIPKYKSVFLLISPSKSFEKQLALCATYVDERRCAMSWQNILRLLSSDAVRNWREYMTFMEEEIRKESDRLVLAEIDSERNTFYPLTDYNISFVDRQTLKQLEDKVVDLGIILSTMHENLIGICDYVRRVSQDEHSTDQNVIDAIIEELEALAREAEASMSRGAALKVKVKSVIDLLCDLLNYEDAVALKDIGRETQSENQSMHLLTEKSTKDAAAVKVLTIIGLVYLPVTVVTNFFSTQFVNTIDDGTVQVSTSAWLLAAISIPLTALTIISWWTWVYFQLRGFPKVSLTGYFNWKFAFHNALKILRPRMGKRKSSDIEMGLNVGPPRDPCSISSVEICREMHY